MFVYKQKIGSWTVLNVRVFQNKTSEATRTWGHSNLRRFGSDFPKVKETALDIHHIRVHSVDGPRVSERHWGVGRREGWCIATEFQICKNSSVQANVLYPHPMPAKNLPIR